MAPPVLGGDCYTFEDLAHTPDDGKRYEVIGGSLVVTPMAGGEHQRVVMELAFQLRAVRPDGFAVLPGAQLHLGTDGPIPDVVVVRDQPRLPAAFTETDILLAIEVTSPRQQLRDLVTKRALYEAAGIPVYVVVDGAELVVFELRDGRYVERGRGPEAALRQPYPVTLRLPVPSGAS